jgi:hypothetical protein
MRKLYTTYLTYPHDIDRRIRDIYDAISKRWTNKRSFEFLPMIPVWKVYVDDALENKLVMNISALADTLKTPLITKGLKIKPETGYIFLTFDDSTSVNLVDFSKSVRTAMRVEGFEDSMPYGYEPHTSIFKQDPTLVQTIHSSIVDQMIGIEFTPETLVVSRETIANNTPCFDKILIHSFKRHASLY